MHSSQNHNPTTMILAAIATRRERKVPKIFKAASDRQLKKLQEEYDSIGKERQEEKEKEKASLTR